VGVVLQEGSLNIHPLESKKKRVYVLYRPSKTERAGQAGFSLSPFFFLEPGQRSEDYKKKNGDQASLQYFI
jgi:hypothetical protein